MMLLLTRRLPLVPLLLGLSLALTSCGQRALSPQAYQEWVIHTLQGKELGKGLPPLPGLIPTAKRLFDSLYCAEYNCGLASEMQYLAQVAQDQRDAVDLHRGKICSKGVRPPPELKEDHERICSLLDEIRRDMDAIGLTATYATQAISSSSGSDEAQKSTKGFSRKILEFKSQILGSLQQLREIEWLKPVFVGAEDQIPELEAEASGIG